MSHLNLLGTLLETVEPSDTLQVYVRPTGVQDLFKRHKSARLYSVSGQCPTVSKLSPSRNAVFAKRVPTVTCVLVL